MQSSKKASRNKEKAGKKAAGPGPMPSDALGGTALLAVPLFVVMIAALIGAADWARSDVEGCCFFPLRLFLFLVLDSAFSPVCNALFLHPARSLAACLPGTLHEEPPPQSLLPSMSELLHNDETIKWPLMIDRIPEEWVRLAHGRKQPFFLNHVRGATRLKQAAIRLGAALATVLAIITMCKVVERRPLAAVSYMSSFTVMDVAFGVVTGACCITALFLAEWHLGWIVPTHMFETVVPGERWSLNILWDVVFHMGVTFNEELLLRGWMLHSTAEACAAYFGTTSGMSLLVASVAESLLFAAMHSSSPGSSAIGLLNLTIGGMAAALNVVLSGGLSFSLGWHFSWNIFMGHLLGLSTSGIPMSSKLICVVPHPEKARLHGGTFGPEQSVLAPAAYLLGCAMLFGFYGLSALSAS